MVYSFIGKGTEQFEIKSTRRDAKNHRVVVPLVTGSSCQSRVQCCCLVGYHDFEDGMGDDFEDAGGQIQDTNHQALCDLCLYEMYCADTSD